MTGPCRQTRERNLWRLGVLLIDFPAVAPDRGDEICSVRCNLVGTGIVRIIVTGAHAPSPLHQTVGGD